MKKVLPWILVFLLSMICIYLISEIRSRDAVIRLLQRQLQYWEMRDLMGRYYEMHPIE